LATTVSYFSLWSSVIFVDLSTSSASWPIQYSRVLICRGSSSANPDATRNWSNRLFHRGQSSGFLKSNGSGDSSRMLAISCHHVVFSVDLLLLQEAQRNTTRPGT
jgi:hypothetical protein